MNKHTSGKMDVEYDASLVFDHEIIGRIGKDTSTIEECRANAERITALWNAANGMTTEQAVAYLRHGAKMEKALKTLIRVYWANKGTDGEFIVCITPDKVPPYWLKANNILTKLETDHGK